MQIIDPAHPFYRAAWRRWVIVLVPTLWAANELWSGNPGWALLFGAVAAYAGWVLLVTYKGDAG